MKLRINNNQIKYDTSKASLITLPNSKNKAFWLSNKCVFSLSDGYSSIYVNEDYEYRVINHKSKSKDFIEMDGYSIIDFFDDENKTIAKVHTPKKMESVEIEADDELKR